MLSFVSNRETLCQLPCGNICYPRCLDSRFKSKHNLKRPLLGLLGAANRYIESNIEYGSGRLDIAIWYRDRAFMIKLKSISLSDLKKLGIEREYKDLDDATEEEKSRIRTQLLALKDVALQQIDEQQYIDGFMQRHPDVKTVRCYGVAFCRRWVEVAMGE